MFSIIALVYGEIVDFRRKSGADMPQAGTTRTEALLVKNRQEGSGWERGAAGVSNEWMYGSLLSYCSLIAKL